MEAEFDEFIKQWEFCGRFNWLYADRLAAYQRQGAILCTCQSPCDDIFAIPKDTIGNSYEKTVAKTFVEIENSAINGCEFCKYLYENFKSSEFEPATGMTIEYAHQQGHWRFCFQLGSLAAVRILQHYEDIYPTWIKNENGIDTEAKENWDEENLNLSALERENKAVMDLTENMRENGRDFSVEDRQHVSAAAKISQLSLARTWYILCHTQHDDCEHGRDADFYPMRLIDVSGPSPHLVLSGDSNEGLSKPYATLSHRWTSSDTLFSLTADNISRYQTQITEEDMSPTFRDAILVCQALEVQYLWIDSMCIIQSGEGSLADWQKNGLAMSSIYANSMVNIAAETIDPEQGFLQHETLADLRSPTRFKISGYEFVIYPSCFGSHIPRPLEKRGWIVQEMLLAPRILRFGISQMSWECTKSPLACEAFPAGMQPDLAVLVDRESFISPHGRDQNRLRKLRREILRLQLAQSDPESSSADQSTFKLKELWLDVVEAYSNCDLTFADKDKFMAMSGIASRVGDVMKSDYIAGSFRNMFPRALLWKVEKPGSFSKDAVHRGPVPAGSSDYRAPTWSWGSLDKAVDFKEYVFHAEYALLAEVLDTVVVRTHEENRYGPIQQADLIVRGNIARLQWSPEHLDIILDSEKYKHSYFLDEDTTPQSSQLLFLEIQHATIYSSSRGAEVYGLLLEEIDREHDDMPRARRLGLMKVELPESEMKLESITLRLV